MSITSDWNEYFKIEEKHLTVSAIRRLKIAVIAAAPMILVASGLDFTSSDSHLAWHLIVIIAIITSLIAMAYVCVNPLSNNLAQNNKHLDEWGISHKLAAQSFGFRITSGLVSILWMAALIGSFSPQIAPLKFSLSVYDIASLMLSAVLFLWLTSTAHIAWTIRPITMEDGLPVRENKAVVTARQQKVEAAIILCVVGLILLASFVGAIALGWMSAHNAAGH